MELSFPLAVHSTQQSLNGSGVTVYMIQSSSKYDWSDVLNEPCRMQDHDIQFSFLFAGGNLQDDGNVFVVGEDVIYVSEK